MRTGGWRYTYIRSLHLPAFLFWVLWPFQGLKHESWKVRVKHVFPWAVLKDKSGPWVNAFTLTAIFLYSREWNTKQKKKISMMNQRDRRREKIKTFFFLAVWVRHLHFHFALSPESYGADKASTPSFWTGEEMHNLTAASSKDSHASFRVLLFISTLWFFLCPWCVFEVQEMWNYFLQCTLVQESHIYNLCSLVQISIFISYFKTWIIFFLPLTCFILQLNFSFGKAIGFEYHWWVRSWSPVLKRLY